MKPLLSGKNRGRPAWSIPRGMLRALALLFSLLAAAPAAANVDSLARELRRLEGKGYMPVKRITQRVSGGRLAVVTLRKRGRIGLRVYRVTRRKARLIHLEPGFGKTISLASIHDNGRIPDLVGDGSRVVAYRVNFKGSGQEKLIVLRYAGAALTRAGELPRGRFEDIDGDGRREIVSRSRPLGQWFQIECGNFFSRAETAFRTTVYAWKGPKLAAVSRKHPGFFKDRIGRQERALHGRNPWDNEDYGGYLGDALSLYFDYAEIGKQRQGWEKFLSLFPIPRLAPPGTRRCSRQMRRTLRERLDIPADW